jgi:hypothetical protein
MSMKNSNITVGNRTRDLSACSAVPQPIAPLRATAFQILYQNIKLQMYLWNLNHNAFRR